MSSEDRQQALRISVEEVEQVLPRQTPRRLVRPRPAAHGMIAPLAAPKVIPKKTRVLFQTWLYLGFAGMMGALLAWAIAEQGFLDSAKSGWGNLLLMPMVVSLTCVSLSAVESLIERSWNKVLKRVAVSVVFGLVIGYALNRAAEALYGFGLGIYMPQAMKVISPQVWAVRGIAWAILGVAGGLVYGVAGQSVRKAAYGVLGGALGAGLGGFLFDPISILTHGGALSRATGLGLLGLATGSAIGLVENALKERWLYVTAGPLAGKQFILYKTETIIGSHQKCDIYLFKDPDIEADHAVLQLRASCLYLRANGPVFVSGEAIHGEVMLDDGAELHIGRYGFRYQEKEQ